MGNLLNSIFINLTLNSKISSHRFPRPKDFSWQNIVYGGFGWQTSSLRLLIRTTSLPDPAVNATLNLVCKWLIMFSKQSCTVSVGGFLITRTLPSSCGSSSGHPIIGNKLKNLLGPRLLSEGWLPYRRGNARDRGLGRPASWVSTCKKGSDNFNCEFDIKL